MRKDKHLKWRYYCADCQRYFEFWKHCRKHVKATGHMDAENNKGLQQRCMAPEKKARALGYESRPRHRPVDIIDERDREEPLPEYMCIENPELMSLARYLRRIEHDHDWPRIERALRLRIYRILPECPEIEGQFLTSCGERYLLYPDEDHLAEIKAAEEEDMALEEMALEEGHIEPIPIVVDTRRDYPEDARFDDRMDYEEPSNVVYEPELEDPSNVVYDPELDAPSYTNQPYPAFPH